MTALLSNAYFDGTAIGLIVVGAFVWLGRPVPPPDPHGVTAIRARLRHEHGEHIVYPPQRPHGADRHTANGPDHRERPHQTANPVRPYVSPRHHDVTPAVGGAR